MEIQREAGFEGGRGCTKKKQFKRLFSLKAKKEGLYRQKRQAWMESFDRGRGKL